MYPLQLLVEEDLQHALLSCSYNDGVGQSLLAAVQNAHPEMTPDCLLRLELGNLPDEDELPLMTFISTCLMEIWKKRFEKLRIRLYDIRATLEARCLLLRETRFSENIQPLINLVRLL